MEFLGMEIDKSTLIYRYVVSGGIIMAVLIPLSIYALGFVIQAFIRMRRSRIAPANIQACCKNLSSSEEFEAFREFLKQNQSPLARMAAAYLRAASHGEPAHPEENPAPMDAELDRLYHALVPLTVVYTIAPLVGLLGTILGLMNTFFQYAVVRQQDLEVLSVGINEALVTTMWGLCIAIPAYVASSILRGRVFHYEKDVFPQAVEEIINDCKPFIDDPVKEPVS